MQTCRVVGSQHCVFHIIRDKNCAAPVEQRELTAMASSFSFTRGRRLTGGPPRRSRWTALRWRPTPASACGWSTPRNGRLSRCRTRTSPFARPTRTRWSRCRRSAARPKRWGCPISKRLPPARSRRWRAGRPSAQNRWDRSFRGRALVAAPLASPVTGDWCHERMSRSATGTPAVLRAWPVVWNCLESTWRRARARRTPLVVLDFDPLTPPRCRPILVSIRTFRMLTSMRKGVE